MSTGRVAVGVLMASFLVWLWRYSPDTEDEVSAWLEERGLASTRRLSPIKGELGEHVLRNTIILAPLVSAD